MTTVDEWRHSPGKIKIAGEYYHRYTDGNVTLLVDEDINRAGMLTA